MAINATNTSKPRELIPPGTYIARCYQMVEIGHVTEEIKGKKEHLHKARVGWELPGELRVFKEEDGPQPLIISKDYILALGKKTNLRKTLDSWRGIPLTEEHAKIFDMTTLVGACCLLNIIHKTSTNTGSTYEEIAAITPVVKGMEIPKPVNPKFILSYDAWDQKKFDTLPDFIKEKMKTSDEYKALAPANGDMSRMNDLAAQNAAANKPVTPANDLPF